MNYDNMSAHELVLAIAEEGEYTGLTALPHDDLTPIESALRRAVIREATVSEATAKVIEYIDGITAPVGSPDRIVTCSEQLICPHWIPEGTYYLIKKEG